MGLDWAQLGQMAASLTQSAARPGSAQATNAMNMQDRFGAIIQNEAMKKQAEAEEKKEKSGILSKLGSTLGSAAGVALAPLTGGASLAIPAALGAVGGAAGGAIGTWAGGGQPTLSQALLDAGQGAMGGFMAGKGAAAAATAVPQAGRVAGGMVPAQFAPGVNQAATQTLNNMVRPSAMDMFGRALMSNVRINGSGGIAGMLGGQQQSTWRQDPYGNMYYLGN